MAWCGTDSAYFRSQRRVRNHHARQKPHPADFGGLQRSSAPAIRLRHGRPSEGASPYALHLSIRVSTLHVCDRISCSFAKFVTLLGEHQIGHWIGPVSTIRGIKNSLLPPAEGKLNMQ